MTLGPLNAEACLGQIAARGGYGHWTWSLIDSVMGAGWSERETQTHEAAVQARYMKYLATSRAEAATRSEVR